MQFVTSLAAILGPVTGWEGGKVIIAEAGQWKVAVPALFLYPKISVDLCTERPGPPEREG